MLLDFPRTWEATRRRCVMDTDRNDEIPEDRSAPEETEGREQVLARTKDHDTIRRWADDHHATPATAPDPEGSGLSVLRLDFRVGVDIEELTPIAWNEWFAAFDERGLTFAYEEGTRPDGSRTNNFHLEGPGERP
jgi:hypothetical protein